MKGSELLKRIKGWGYKNADVAKLLNITEQHYNRKMEAMDLKVSFIIELANVLNKNVYELLGINETNIFSEPKSEYGKTNIELELLHENRNLRLRIEGLEKELQQSKSNNKIIT